MRFFCPSIQSIRMCLQVEMRKENDFYPRVIASPSDGKVIDKRSYLENASLTFCRSAPKKRLITMRFLTLR